MKYRFTFSDANRPVSSVTKFGKVPPFWQNFKTLKQCFEGLDNVGQKFEPTLAKLLLYYWANLNRSKWPNIKQIIQTSDHTAGQAGQGRSGRVIFYFFKMCLSIRSGLLYCWTFEMIFEACDISKKMKKTERGEGENFQLSFEKKIDKSLWPFAS